MLLHLANPRVLEQRPLRQPPECHTGLRPRRRQLLALLAVDVVVVVVVDAEDTVREPTVAEILTTTTMMMTTRTISPPTRWKRISKRTMRRDTARAVLLAWMIRPTTMGAWKSQFMLQEIVMRRLKAQRAQRSRSRPSGHLRQPAGRVILLLTEVLKALQRTLVPPLRLQQAARRTGSTSARANGHGELRATSSHLIVRLIGGRARDHAEDLLLAYTTGKRRCSWRYSRTKTIPTLRIFCTF